MDKKEIILAVMSFCTGVNLMNAVVNHSLMGTVGLIGCGIWFYITYQDGDFNE